MPRRVLPLLGMLMCMPWSPVSAQTDSIARSESSAWQTGGAVLIPQAADSYGVTFLALGITATSVRPGRLGPDLAFVIVPRALQAGALVGGVRANAALPIALSSAATLVPSAGVSLLGAAGSFGFGGIGGVNATVAVHLFPGARTDPLSKSGLRVALGQHRFSGAEGSVTFIEFGFVRR